MTRKLLTFAASLLLGVGLAQAATFNLFSPATGILKGSSNTYVTTAAASSDVIGLWSGTCNASSFLRGDGACAGAGNVTSVALTAPSVFSVSGSPITSAGTLGLTFATGQTQNQVLATPDGSTGALSLRSLVAADLPSISLTSGVTGTLPVGNGGTGATTLTGLLIGNGTSAFTTVTAPSGSVVGTSDSQTLTNKTISGASNTISGLTVAQGGTGAATLSGVLKGNGTSAIGAAASSDVIGLWSGTCNSGTFLRADGSCQTAGGGTPGGSDTQVQYNSSGAFAGDAGMTYNAGTDTLTVGNATISTAATVGGVTLVSAAQLPRRAVTGTDNTASTDCGKIIDLSNSAYTFTLDSDPAVNCVLTLINSGSGTITLAASGTLTWYAGGGSLTTGSRTLAIGAVVTVTVLSTAGTWAVWGTGIN